MRIALVEPSRTIQRIVTGIIEPWGHEVHTFMDAPEALACLRADTDIRTPITSAELGASSGIQLVSEARMLADAQRPLYIILMSSSEQRSRMVLALDSGADDFISKPPAPEELRARLRAADRITSMQAELIKLATIDSLTGLLTRRAFVAAATRILNRATAGHPLSVFIGDLDKFRKPGDTIDAMTATIANDIAGCSRCWWSSPWASRGGSTPRPRSFCSSSPALRWRSFPACRGSSLRRNWCCSASCRR
jgi:two-component system cell cycle response regulator